MIRLIQPSKIPYAFCFFKVFFFMNKAVGINPTNISLFFWFTWDNEVSSIYEYMNE